MYVETNEQTWFSAMHTLSKNDRKEKLNTQTKRQRYPPQEPYNKNNKRQVIGSLSDTKPKKV